MPNLECPNCGIGLANREAYCPGCGQPTQYYHAQRTCLNCGASAAVGAETCMMCGHAIDQLPRQARSLSNSWPAILFGVVIVVGLVYWFMQFQRTPAAEAAVETATITPTVFVAPPTETPTPTHTPTTPPTATFTVTPTPTPEPIIHTIKTGETLNFIAGKYNVSLADLGAANDITQNDILSVGQELVIPFPDTGLNNDDTPGYMLRYTIQSGDTLSGIAFEYDTTVDAIALMNPGLDLDLLSVGIEIIVPLKPPTETPTPTVTPTATFTPGPPYLTPYLLGPTDNAIIEGDGVRPLLQWTSGGLLAADEYYVLHLTTDDDNLLTFWTQTTSYRLPDNLRPPDLSPFSWYVVVMREIGIDPDGRFYGETLSSPSETWSFQWR